MTRFLRRDRLEDPLNSLPLLKPPSFQPPLLVRPGAGAMPAPALWLNIGLWMFENSPDCVTLLDRRGRMLRMNGNGQSLMEIDDFEELAGKDWESIWPASSRERVRAAIAAVRKGELYEFQAPCPTVRDAPKWWDVRVMPMHQNGEVSHILSVSRDITRLMDAQQAEQLARSLAVASARSAEKAARAKSEFVADVSHELRTPLTAIAGLAHLLQNMNPTEQQRAQLQQIELAGRHAAMLMEEMLDLTEAESGNLRLRENEFSLEGALQETQAVVRQIARSRGLDLSLELDAGLPGRATGDSERLSRILLNCATSAAKLSGRSRLELAARVARRRKDKALIVFELKRADACLDPREVRRLLGEGSDEPDHRSGLTRGLGFGLSISKAMAERMGGNLGIDSDPESGTTFWFTVQVGIRADDTEDERYASPSPRLEGRRVLVVEDDPLARHVVQHLLELAGMIVEVACDGQEGVEAVRARAFDVVLMDIQMPVMRGVEATRLIREELGLTGLPVIALTGNVLEKDRLECMAAGASDFLGKPVDAGKLWRTLARWMPVEQGGDAR